MVKRKNRHLLDVVCTLLLESSVPSKFWVEALSTTVYLINRLPYQVLNFDSPYYHLYHQHPSYLNMHTFGCVCFVHLPHYERNKFLAQSVNVSLWVIVFITKVMFAMILVLTNFVYPTLVESLPEISILPCFDDLPPLLDRFKPGLSAYSTSTNFAPS